MAIRDLSDKDFGYFVRLGQPPPAEEATPYAWIAALVALVVLAPLALYLAWVFYWKPRRAARAPADPRTMDLVGEEGEAATDLAPDGTCRILGRTWPCRAQNGRTISAGTRILVVQWEGDHYVVAPAAGEGGGESGPAQIERSLG